MNVSRDTFYRDKEIAKKVRTEDRLSSQIEPLTEQKCWGQNKGNMTKWLINLSKKELKSNLKLNRHPKKTGHDQIRSELRPP